MQPQYYHLSFSQTSPFPVIFLLLSSADGQCTHPSLAVRSGQDVQPYKFIEMKWHTFHQSVTNWKCFSIKCFPMELSVLFYVYLMWFCQVEFICWQLALIFLPSFLKLINSDIDEWKPAQTHLGLVHKLLTILWYNFWSFYLTTKVSKGFKKFRGLHNLLKKYKQV